MQHFEYLQLWGFLIRTGLLGQASFAKWEQHICQLCIWKTFLFEPRFDIFISKPPSRVIRAELLLSEFIFNSPESAQEAESLQNYARLKIQWKKFNHLFHHHCSRYHSQPSLDEESSSESHRNHSGIYVFLSSMRINKQLNQGGLFWCGKLMCSYFMFWVGLDYI